MTDSAPSLRSHVRQRAVALGAALAAAALLAVAARGRVAIAAAGKAAATAAPVTLTHLSVAGWSISDGRHTILIDPYFSRPKVARVRGDDGRFHLQGAPDEAAIAAHAPAHADLILVGHAHIDHALDAPLLARRTHAALGGSAELVKQARAAGVPDDQLLLLKGGEDFQFDGFSVRVLPSLHSFIGLADGGDVETLAYLVRIGGKQIFVLGTANFIEREVEGLRPDAAILGIGFRDKVHDYSCRLMRALGRPRLVLANHFDDWHAPLGAALEADTRAALTAFTAEIHGCAPATRVIVPQQFTPIPLP